MKNIRMHKSKWSYLPYPAQRTLQIGPLFATCHFPGCSSWSIEISTAQAHAVFPKFYAIGDGFEEVHWSRILRSPWRSITLRLGKPLITLHLSRESFRRYLRSLESATAKS